MTLEKRAQQGGLAREVLENEAYVRAHDAIKKEYIEAWLNAPQRDKEGREEIWLTIKLLDKLKATLEATMMDGRMARIETERLEAILAEQRRQGLNLDGMH